jgi:hypothetical protein
MFDLKVCDGSVAADTVKADFVDTLPAALINMCHVYISMANSRGGRRIRAEVTDSGRRLEGNIR